ncbi:hypothetical protein AB0C96_42705 [Streptomyces sp. NPDC048506]|uniref:hypothetical protein n=1 Tax=Streptomyces sp. NPDC048506 TaxID=3155028 RepID=UPI00343D114D
MLAAVRITAPHVGERPAAGLPLAHDDRFDVLEQVMAAGSHPVHPSGRRRPGDRRAQAAHTPGPTPH